MAIDILCIPNSNTQAASNVRVCPTLWCVARPPLIRPHCLGRESSSSPPQEFERAEAEEDPLLLPVRKNIFNKSCAVSLINLVLSESSWRHLVLLWPRILTVRAWRNLVTEEREKECLSVETIHSSCWDRRCTDCDGDLTQGSSPTMYPAVQL